MDSRPHKPRQSYVIQPAPPEGPGILYATAEAFHDALKARLNDTAIRSPYGLNELRRQFAYDRLLTRVFFHDPERWVLKGATGLLVRIPGKARHSVDVDLYFQGEAEAATASMAASADLELGDFFTFDIESGKPLTGDNRGVEIKVAAYIGDTVFMGFRVDAVIATNMTGTPELTPGLTAVEIDGLPTAAYRTYPVVDHIADKHAAMVAFYADGAPSTRYRDLVDLVLWATTQSPKAKFLHHALMSEYRHRGLAPPTEVSLPSPEWVAGYANSAAVAPNFAYPSGSDGRSARFDYFFRKEHSCPVDLTIRDLPTLSNGMPPS